MRYKNTYFILGDFSIYKEALEYTKKIFLIAKKYYPIIDSRYQLICQTGSDLTEKFYYDLYGS
jgi:hypothetical protein